MPALDCACLASIEETQVATRIYVGNLPYRVGEGLCPPSPRVLTYGDHVAMLAMVRVLGGGESTDLRISEPRPVNATSESVRFLHNLRGTRVQLARGQRSFATNSTFRQACEDSHALERDGGHEVLACLNAATSVTAAPQGYAPTA